MPRLRITHKTAYHYNTPVSFGTHRAMLRPRASHELRVLGASVEIEPVADIRWLLDIEGNSVAVLTFAQPAARLSLLTQIDVELLDDNRIECLIDPIARLYPFQYSAEEQVALIPYRLPSYPLDGSTLHNWLSALYQPGQLIDTFELLNRLNTYIYQSLNYRERYEHGVQLPHETLSLGGGTCRDYAVLMMEAARYWGFGARFVSGYVRLEEGQHGSTHAWTEIYLPGAGWRGFDPTNNKLAGIEHIPVAVAREQEHAAPLGGSWDGPSDAFERMDVSVQVVSIS
jgi:transglutaminase-like putative cysteine protease